MAQTTLDKGPQSAIEWASTPKDCYNRSVNDIPNNDQCQPRQSPSINTANELNFFKSVSWSPDGNYLMTNSNDNIVKIFPCPENNDDYTNTHKTELTPITRIPGGETVLDVAWYPYMAKNDPSTGCFLMSTRDRPIQLQDIYTGMSRASYRAVDDKDELITATSMAFHPNGSTFYAGYREQVNIFELSRPGDPIETIPTSPKRKSKDGQKGIISSISFPALDCGMYSTGSFNGTIALWSSQDSSIIDLIRVPKLAGGHHGITKLQFTPDGSYLFASSRKAKSIVCYDPRNLSQPLALYPRSSPTQQRLGFDIDPYQQWLAAGEHDGSVLFYTLSNWPDPEDPKPTFQVGCHQDVVSDIDFHPTEPVFATVSGQRKFDLNDDDNDDEEGSKTVVDNSLKLWKYDRQWTTELD